MFLCARLLSILKKRPEVKCLYCEVLREATPKIPASFSTPQSPPPLLLKWKDKNKVKDDILNILAFIWYMREKQNSLRARRDEQRMVVWLDRRARAGGTRTRIRNVGCEDGGECSEENVDLRWGRLSSAKLGETSTLKRLLDAIKELVTTNFDCNEECIHLQAMDKSHVALREDMAHTNCL
ncbi:hypothetical protein HGRIS_001043 [Hohenbuehelia grisea]|uniref:Proliferating cell nuclear antigen PCNA N-terminal domain-containing protein n=1 Tax=Hohenbuehelia grisea TaxID=104357 RepID=A0ABR3JN36_9AGAR